MAIDIVPGGVFGGNIAFQYRGPGGTFWVGFGISPHRVDDEIYQYAGGVVTINPAPDWVTIGPLTSTGWLIDNPPYPDQHHECRVFVCPGTTPNLAAALDKKWYDDVYNVRPSEVKDISASFF